MKFILILILMISEALAIEAVVVVLEAPYFQSPDEDSYIVQYKRKGDIITIHPSVDNTDKFNHLAPEAKKLARVRNKLRKTPEWNEDPMFKGDEDDTFTLQDDFIAVLDRRGKRAFIKKEHIYVYFNDTREFVQTPYRTDETDYRLEEPLPKNYPLPNQRGFRGIFLFGILQPYSESYPYLKSAKTKSYQSPLDFSVTMMRENSNRKNDRFYIGGSFNFRHFKNQYSFIGGNTSSEENYRFGLGPFASYDAFKGVKDRVNVFAGVNVYLLNSLSITQRNSAGDADNRNYKAYTVSPRIGIQYHRKEIFPEIDFVLGTSFEVEAPSTYKAQDGAHIDGIWRRNGSDSFQTGFIYNVGGFIGLQSAY